MTFGDVYCGCRRGICAAVFCGLTLDMSPDWTFDCAGIAGWDARWLEACETAGDAVRAGTFEVGCDWAGGTGGTGGTYCDPSLAV